MAATRARTDSSAGPRISTETDSIKSGQREDETPTRRTTNRTRKLPSRLLPSPSPPPTRPALTHAKHAKADSAAAVLPATPVVMIPHQQSKSKRPTKSDSPALASDHASASDHESVDIDASIDDLGPGKRKRRPSSMYRPPSTITTAEPASSNTASTTKSKKKGRSTSPDASVSVKLPSSHTPVTYGKNRSRFSKTNALNSKRHAISDLSEGEHDEHHANDSEMESEPTLAARSAKKMRQSHLENASDLSPPPLLPRDGSARIQMPAELTQPTFTRGGQVSVSPESGHKRARLGIKAFARTDADLGDRAARLRLADEARAAKLDSMWRPTDGLSSSPQSPAVSRFDHSSLTRPIFGSFLGVSPGRTQLRGTNVTFDAADDEEEEDDEDDFHQAMLDADLDFFESQKTELTAAKSWLLSEPQPSDHDMDDTPATTPRSPQSGCDPATPGSPTFKTEEVTEEASDKAAFAASRDTVFVHALPTTQVGANKPHQHAGSLTLSLPYSPEIAASSPQLKAVDVERDAKPSLESKTRPQLSTPILQRRKYAGPSHGLAALKFGSEAIERVNSSASHFMQLSPMIELDSPLLSPGLSLSLPGKVPDPPSPFVIGVSALPELDQPAPLALPPSKEPTHKDEASQASAGKGPVHDTIATHPKHEMVALKRPALPPPRQIRFTTFTTADVSSPKQQQQQPQPSVTRRSAVLSQTQPKIPSTVTRTSAAITDQTPDLIYSGSSSPDSVSESASPLSRSDSDSYADAEVENILFGPPEKLDLRELDQVWGGSKANLSGLVASSSDSGSSAALRRAKSSRVHVGRTSQ